jgi:hypothetical protein
MRQSFIFLFILFVNQACSQRGNLTDSKQGEISKSEYGAFEDYAFLVDGEVVEQKGLIAYPDLKLSKIFPYRIALEEEEYRGAIYFNTSEQPANPTLYNDDPAYFINDLQVSPQNIRSLAPEVYNDIEKSLKDTVIDNRQYRGWIRINTAIDFSAECTAISTLLDRYPDLPLDQIIVHWRGSNYKDKSDIGLLIHDHFQLHHIHNTNPKVVNINKIRFAEGDRYVVELVDDNFKGMGMIPHKVGGRKENQMKIQSIFKNPLSVDTDCTCCLADFDTTAHDIFNIVEIMPKPYQGEEYYLQKLSTTMELPIEKNATHLLSESITVQFFVTQYGLLTGLTSVSTDKPEYAEILRAINRNACLWSAGIHNGRFVPAVKRKMTIFYSKDQEGNIQSLDSLAYRIASRESVK